MESQVCLRSCTLKNIIIRDAAAFTQNSPQKQLSVHLCSLTTWKNKVLIPVMHHLPVGVSAVLLEDCRSCPQLPFHNFSWELKCHDNISQLHLFDLTSPIPAHTNVLLTYSRKCAKHVQFYGLASVFDPEWFQKPEESLICLVRHCCFIASHV